MSLDNNINRPRSNSVRKIMSTQNTPIQTPQKKNYKRSMSVSEGLHLKLPILNHSETDHFTTTTPIQSTNNPSESNWANRYDDFDIGKPIGYGSSAIVYEAIYKPTQLRVTVKTIDLDMFERNQIDELRRETSLMALSKHPNVLRVFGSFVNGSKLYIVTPYLAAGSCLDIMKTSFQEGFDEISIATILRQALEGLIYLHKNGHIHRDVKAGNLLMDENGTVLLADFGVSSSLTDNTDVRKTFVGTPCWMAPEVMEQAGYNYKADIWSFGITALELATGHAPFAKYPPMKVLMMTLSNDPPTLDRENGKHKYSKSFKDMIDACLQKDPTKRPSADKLMSHPFFKQSKKKDFLIKSVLQHVPLLDQRPHKKIPQKHISFETTEQWDFDDQPTPPTPRTPSNTPNVILPPPNSNLIKLDSSNQPTLDRSKSVVQFEDCPKPIHVNRHTPSSSMDHTFENIHKKHISFGDAVIKDTSVKILTPSSNVIESIPPNIMTSQEPSATPTTLKKSRFIIEDNNHDHQIDTLVNSPSTLTEIQNPVGLGISTTSASTPINTTNTNTTTNSVSNVNTNQNLIASNIASNNNTLQEGEFKKGRFSVNQTPNRSNTPMEDTSPLAHVSLNDNKFADNLKSTLMSRAGSQESLERKSRFEVKHNPTHSTSTMASVEPPASISSSSTLFQSFPLSRENSNTTTPSQNSTINRVSRFSIEKPEAIPSSSELLNLTPLPPPVTPNAAVTLSPECRKKGRFELTGGTPTDLKPEHSEPLPPSTLSNAHSPTLSPHDSFSRGQINRLVEPNVLYHQLESLIKQNELQKNLLQDLLGAVGPTHYTIHNTVHSQSSSNGSVYTRSRTVSDAVRPLHIDEDLQRLHPSQHIINSPNSKLHNDINSTIEHLQQLLLQSSKEKERLSMENETLKKEIERMKKAQGDHQLRPSEQQQQQEQKLQL